jgi:hypothetical protein
MDVQIRWKAVTRSHDIEDYLAWRLRFAAGRLADRVTAVSACFEGLNEPGGGLDKRCAIELDGALGRLRAEVCDVDLYAAVDRVTDAIGCSMKAAELLRAYA